MCTGCTGWYKNFSDYLGLYKAAFLAGTLDEAEPFVSYTNAACCFLKQMEEVLYVLF